MEVNALFFFFFGLLIGHLVTCCLVLIGWIIHGNRETNQEQHHCRCVWKQKKKVNI